MLDSLSSLLIFIWFTEIGTDEYFDVGDCSLAFYDGDLIFSSSITLMVYSSCIRVKSFLYSYSFLAGYVRFLSMIAICLP